MLAHKEDLLKYDKPPRVTKEHSKSDKYLMESWVSCHERWKKNANHGISRENHGGWIENKI